MTELTTKEEDIMLEEGLERARDIAYEKKLEREGEECEICHKKFLEEETDIVTFKEGQTLRVCNNCEEELYENEPRSEDI